MSAEHAEGSSLGRLLTELRNRKLVQWAIAYVAGAWLLLQVTDVLSSLLPVPDWTGSLVFILLAIGFPLVLIFSWIYELTPEGVKREKEVDRSRSITPETGRKINILIVVLLVLAIAGLGVAIYTGTVLLMRRKLTRFYWAATPEDHVPFQGIIESTNLIEPDHIGGAHLFYLMHYVHRSEPAYSRDDAERGFLLHYVEHGILPTNPFQALDWDGVGELVKMGVQKGRQTRPELEVGICGEHGGDPSSVAFCHKVGLDYVSCSPFRVPIARLAAAKAAIASPR